MDESQQPSTTLRGVGAVFIGIPVIVILSIAADMAMRLAGIFPPLGQSMSDKLFLVATAYRILFGIAGGYITARLAPAKPVAHALMLGAIGLALCIVGAAITWNKGPEFGPKWYPLALIALAIPQCWLGGLLRVMHLHGRS
jgi:hypothetical protein